jgi:hypothetical protein
MWNNDIHSMAIKHYAESRAKAIEAELLMMILEGQFLSEGWGLAVIDEFDVGKSTYTLVRLPPELKVLPQRILPKGVMQYVIYR